MTNEVFAFLVLYFHILLDPNLQISISILTHLKDLIISFHISFPVFQPVPPRSVPQMLKDDEAELWKGLEEAT